MSQLAAVVILGDCCHVVLLVVSQLFARQLAEHGYAGLEVRVTPLRTEIIIKATRTQDVLGEKGQRIRELTSVVQKRCVCLLYLFVAILTLHTIIVSKCSFFGFSPIYSLFSIDLSAFRLS